MNFKLNAFLFLILSSISFQALSNSNESKAYIPDPLIPWAQWVMEGEGARKCTLLHGKTGRSVDDFSCISHTATYLEEKDNNLYASFTSQADQPSLVALPSPRPNQIKINNINAPVFHRGDGLFLLVDSGSNFIEMTWQSPPSFITWPSSLGPVVMNDRFLSRDRGGISWRGGSESGEQQSTIPDNHTFEVWRLFEDGQTPFLHTQIKIHVSGSNRVETIENIIPDGFEVTSWNFDLPMEIDGTSARLDLSSGTWNLNISARCLDCDLSSSFQFSLENDAWNHEIWSVREDNLFRTLKIEAQAVDSTIANVPPQWQSWPSFRISSGRDFIAMQDKLGVERDAGSLSIKRVARKSNGKWIVEDNIQGSAPSGSFLSLSSPAIIKYIEFNNQPWPLVEGQGGQVGAVWRGGDFNAKATYTTPSLSNVSGWNMETESVERVVYDERFWLFGGGDRERGTWVSSLNVWIVFWSALVGMMLWRRAGKMPSILATSILLFSFSSPLAILTVSMSVFVVISLILKSLQEKIAHGYFSKVIKVFIVLMAVVFSFVFVSYSVKMSKSAFYPHLSINVYQDQGHDHGQGFTAQSPVQHKQPNQVRPTSQNVEMRLMGDDVADPAIASRNAQVPEVGVLMSYDDNDSAKIELEDEVMGVIPAGISAPVWTKKQVYSYFQGPIQDNNTSTYISMPSWVILLAKIVAILGWALIGFAVFLNKKINMKNKSIKKTAVLSLIALLMPVSLNAQERSMYTQYPPSINEAYILSELKNRLTSPPNCADKCFSVKDISVNASGDKIDVSFDIDVERATTFPVPNPTGAVLVSSLSSSSPSQWMGDEISLKSSGRVELGYIAISSRVEIAFNYNHANFTQQLGDGWQSNSVLPSNKLTHSSWVGERVDNAKISEGVDFSSQSDIAKSYVVLNRQFQYNHDLSITNTITKIGHSQNSLNLKIGYIEGENPDSDRLTRKNDRWEITLGPGERNYSWTSKINNPQSVSFTSLESKFGIETISINPSQLWMVELGDTPLYSDTSMIFKPPPSKKILIKARENKFVSGMDRRVERVDIVSSRGSSQVSHEIKLDVFATTATRLEMYVESDMRLEGVKRKGERLNVENLNGVISIPVLKGENKIEIEFNTPKQGIVFSYPSISFNAPVSNIYYEQKSLDRWVLMGGGAGIGFSVLFWPKILALLFVMYLLSLYKPLDISTREAILLAIGFSFLNGWVLAFVIGCKMMINLKNKSHDWKAVNFNAFQVMFALVFVLTMCVILISVMAGLVSGWPNMSIYSPIGLSQLGWYVDHASGSLPLVWIISLPVFWYKATLCIWALWLAKWVMDTSVKSIKSWTDGGHWKKDNKLVDTGD